MASEQAKHEGAAEQAAGQIGISAQGNLEQVPLASAPGRAEQKSQEGQASGMQQRKEGKGQEGGAAHPDAHERFMQNRARKAARGYGARHVPTSPRKGPHLHEELQAEFAKRGEDSVTIGEALEAAGHARHDKPIDSSDASAIQSAISRATAGVQISTDLSSEAEKAADENERKKKISRDGTVAFEADYHKLGDVLKDATKKMHMDKPVTLSDARRVQSTEQRNDPEHRTDARGISAHFQAAAAFNEHAEPVAQNEPHYQWPTMDGPLLIGEALEVAGHARADKPVDPGDARAIQAAVTRATGDRTGGSLGAEAQQMAAMNLRDDQRAAHEEKMAPGSPKKARTAPGARGAHQHHTLGQLLRNASEDLPTDKAVTHEDARKVMKAESRGDPEHQIEKQGVAAQMQAAAQLNEP